MYLSSTHGRQRYDPATSHALNEMEKFSVCVATPSLRASMTATYVQSVAALQASCHAKGFGFEILLACGISVIDHARNLLVNRFLNETDCSHLFFVDDDMGFDVDEVTEMFGWAGSADVVGVMCPKRKLDWSRIKKLVLANPDIDPAHLANLGGNYEGMFSLSDNAPTFTVRREPTPVNTIGTALMLISRTCFERLRVEAKLVPYDAMDDSGLRCYPFFRSTPGRGEDIAFCDLVRSHGGTVLGASNVAVTHTGSYDYVGDLPGIARYS
jgi:hypothetical protein